MASIDGGHGAPIQAQQLLDALAQGKLGDPADADNVALQQKLTVMLQSTTAHMKRAALLALLIVSLACEARAPAVVATASASASATLPTHREQARAVLEDHCGACHVPDPVTGTALALHIYDLTRPDWSATLSDEQLPILEQKLWEDAGDERERAILRDFVVDELAWREAQRKRAAH